jgi:hypothetical protein
VRQFDSSTPSPVPQREAVPPEESPHRSIRDDLGKPEWRYFENPLQPREAPPEHCSDHDEEEHATNRNYARCVGEVEYRDGQGNANGVLGVSADTIARDWRMARAWLARELDGGS